MGPAATPQRAKRCLDPVDTNEPPCSHPGPVASKRPRLCARSPRGGAPAAGSHERAPRRPLGEEACEAEAMDLDEQQLHPQQQPQQPQPQQRAPLAEPQPQPQQHQQQQQQHGSAAGPHGGGAPLEQQPLPPQPAAPRRGFLAGEWRRVTGLLQHATGSAAP
ncbi:hypothetical protein Rsub_10757 [Raphidocelis subcapitata]|uniref:Uncharacterized protein n=1 Tax=Raphidocelis subcapitata TaxID=307507 RepID=A0A2V0PH75_9CHLO|nr:hypothetical protein Rsub_10757 [Raphidocelis subcapitata]|eukprot:GBF98362.1 hypothetical protein Rsub_10757 [Raphidocelis subcapitata]